VKALTTAVTSAVAVANEQIMTEFKQDRVAEELNKIAEIPCAGIVT